MRGDLSETALCVRCGLCLPHCPTYRLTRNEAESPRGRLSLMQALASGELAASPAAAAHLENCLHCGHCQAACPAKVPYARLIDAAKQQLANAHLARPLPNWLKILTGSRVLLGALAWLFAALELSGARRLARRLGLIHLLGLRDLDAMLPRFSVRDAAPLRRFSDGGNTDRNQQAVAGLFIGCVARALDRRTLHACRRLLQTAGYSVVAPRGQTCCGALRQHGGDAAAAADCKRRNAQAFGGIGMIVSCASGCGAQLQNDLPCQDIHSALLARSERLRFRPLRQSAALHTPCTMRHAHDPEAARKLLERVPELQLAMVGGAGDCCGAAGAHMLQQPQRAGELARGVVRQIADSGARIALSGNVGCAMHLRGQLARRGLNIEVMHPAELLQQALE